MQIRAATDADFEAWFALYEAVAGEGQWIAAELPLDREENRQRFRRHLVEPETAVMVAWADGRIVGALGCQLEHGVVGFGMMVDAGSRRTGVGGALVDACIEWARRQGAHKVALQVWPHNHAARRLYEHKGFRVEGRLRRHYRRRRGELWDAIAMGLVLDEASPGRPGGDGDPGAA